MKLNQESKLKNESKLRNETKKGTENSYGLSASVGSGRPTPPNQTHVVSNLGGGIDPWYGRSHGAADGELVEQRLYSVHRCGVAPPASMGH